MERLQLKGGSGDEEQYFIEVMVKTKSLEGVGGGMTPVGNNGMQGSMMVGDRNAVQ